LTSASWQPACPLAITVTLSRIRIAILSGMRTWPLLLIIFVIGCGNVQFEKAANIDGSNDPYNNNTPPLCQEETIWECGVGTPYEWGDQGLFYGPNQGRYVRVNGPWIQTCNAPNAQYFSDFTDVRVRITSLGDDAALTRVNGAIHMDEQATCAVKNKVTYAAAQFDKRYDLQIDWCDNSGCAGSACRLTISYVGHRKGSCR